MEEATLLFKHLPADLSIEERKDLLHHLGAIRVQVMSRTGSMKNTAFAVFPNKEEASKILKQLHQVDFLGSKLKVEFAHKNQTRVASIVDNEGVEKRDNADQESSKKDDKEDTKPEAKEIKFDETFHIWGVKHQRRPDLCYLYPPPTPTTLTNIMHALAAVPKFYVQVLHLMNKMDLPAPFGAVTSAPPVHPDVRGYVVTDDAAQQEMDISSETESELESDEEDKSNRSKDPIQVKRPLTKKSERRRKRPRLTDLQDKVLPLSDLPTGETPTLTDIFEQALSEHVAASRRIELKLPSATLPIKNDSHQPPQSAFPPAPLPLAQPELVAVRQSHRIHSEATPDMVGNASFPLFASVDTRPESFPGLSQPPPAAEQNFIQTASNQTHREQQPLPDFPPALPVPNSKQPGVTKASQPPADYNPYDVPLPPSLPDQQLVSYAPEQHLQYQWQETTSVPDGQAEELQGGQPEESTGVGGFGILKPQPQTKEASGSEDETQETEWTKSKFISSSELKRLRLSHSEMKEYSVFRRYNEGDPSCRLYIKNLAKQVSEEDIHWLFGRYVNWDDDNEKNRFDIRLMKEGRMKGQAFVAFSSEEAASSALKDTNGFILKEKPMVVQFARSAKAQDDSSSKP